MVKESSSSGVSGMHQQQEEEKKERAGYALCEHVDARDTHSHWLNAEVVGVRGSRLRLHFTGWSASYDAWYEQDSPDVQKQCEWRELTAGRFGQQLRVNNRVDVLDTEGKWLEARVVALSQEEGGRVRIHYKNYSEKWDEWLSANSRKLATSPRTGRIAEIGSFSEAYGAAKFGGKSAKGAPGATGSAEEDEESLQKRLEKIQAEEAKFRRVLGARGLVIRLTEGDGNCLFRGVADQIYGDEGLHMLVRQRCLDYISIEKDFFQEFIIGGPSNFTAYVEAKRGDGVWGDDLEIQAVSEIYDRPVEIYAYAAEPMRTFHEAGEGPPIRLSYHGKAHYNSIIPAEEEKRELSTRPPGEAEDQAIRISRLRNARRRLAEREQELAAKEAEAQAEEQAAANKKEELRAAQLSEAVILKSRQLFEQQGVRDMEAVLAESVAEAKKSEADQVEQAIKASLKDSSPLFAEYLDAEDKQLEAVLASSSKEAERAALDQALTASLGGAALDPAMREVMAQGFSLERATEAFSVVGGNAELMLQYLYGFFN